LPTKASIFRPNHTISKSRPNHTKLNLKGKCTADEVEMKVGKMNMMKIKSQKMTANKKDISSKCY